MLGTTLKFFRNYNKRFIVSERDFTKNRWR